MVTAADDLETRNVEAARLTIEIRNDLFELWELHTPDTLDRMRRIEDDVHRLRDEDYGPDKTEHAGT